MSAARRIAAALRQVGCDAVLLRESGGLPAFPASIQPVRTNISPQADSLGVERPRKAVMFAPGDGVAAQIKAEDRIESRGIIYRVLQAERVPLEGAPAYTWAMLEIIGGEETL